ncbi:hypothetical protein MKW98_030784 [Papaver atlanticum]|uniref:4-hydroxyphenylpyruvate dioxygenase n=1 Tax=Papaver atlanticum TaxID=357466 RepID=A0AAD4S1H1_9MAGN|nr:hypothetical protein MKW98_030784 [Papaver atlanticum]
MENDMQKRKHNNHGGDESLKLVGHENFTRTNPRSDKFHVKKFHHVEFWCSDAINVAQRFSYGLGIQITEKSDLSTGNMVHASYLLHSRDLNILFTAPYSPSVAEILACTANSTASIPTFNHTMARSFSTSHGLGVRAIAIEVDDAESAFNISISCCARPSHPPMEINDGIIISEIQLYGDVVLRYISFKNSNLGLSFLPGFKGAYICTVDLEDFGIRRLDHVAGNVTNLPEVVKYVKMFSGFHEFSQFTIDDLTGVIESGLNSAVLANNGESVLLNITEPVYGTERKSQIQTYLEHNQGEGVGHMAFASEDIFTTLKEMKKRSRHGFEFMPPPPPTYYETLKHRIGDNILKDEQIKECEELGILEDKDDQGVVFQIFAKPVSDRYAPKQRNTCIGIIV